MSGVSRRSFIATAAVAGSLPTLAPALSAAAQLSGATASREEATRKERIRRALLSGPAVITKDATVAEMDRDGKMTILRQGTNEWVCVPGNQDIVGQTDMCLDPMGMIWMQDVMSRKPKPTNTSPGLIYMLNGATQHSYTDPFDRTSPPIPIGPHWMILWPFDPKTAGLSTVMRDAGTMIMFAGTPYAHLHICGDPWEGHEYRSDKRAVWTMRYEDASRGARRGRD